MPTTAKLLTMQCPPLLRAGLASLALLLCLGSKALAEDAARHLAVIDAGSSGSRLHLYERTAAERSVAVKQLFEAKAGEALSSFERSPGDAGPRGIQPLLEQLLDRLARMNIERSAVHVHVLATAGMRRLAADNPAAAQVIYQSVRHTLSSAGVTAGRIETLSGHLEGVYAWVDVNDLSGALAGTPAGATVAVIEVGGASAQLAYSGEALAGAPVTAVRLNGRSHQVVSLTWLGLGQDEARRAMLDAARSRSNADEEQCYPDNRKAAGGLSAFDADGSRHLVTRGRFSFEHCSRMYDAVIRPFDLPALATAIRQSRRPLVGLASVYFSLADWQVIGQPGTLASTLSGQCEGEDAYGDKVIGFIRRDPKNRFAQTACANGTFIHALLFGPAGLRADPAQVSAVARINGQPPSWARGFALLGR
jgi:hypothetical protein